MNSHWISWKSNNKTLYPRARKGAGAEEAFLALFKKQVFFGIIVQVVFTSENIDMGNSPGRPDNPVTRNKFI